jgi:long-chain acyl-CoA synthetase
LRSVQPTLFFAVPRLWAKFKAGVDAKVPADVQSQMNDEQRGQVRAMLGLAKAKFVITGSAPTPVDIQEWFISMGINLRDGYGMTENFIDGCIFNGDEPIPGCVGKTFKGSEVKISEDGEICFRGAGLMLGYYKNPEKTAEVLIDGWYHTGDSGRIDENGNLWVTGRLGEVFKTTKGKFVQPPELENKFGGVSLLAQLLIFGHGKDQPLLLTNLSEVAHASGKDQAAISAELEVALEQINSQLPPYEKIPQIFITKEDWRIDNGLLTPTMKLKRRQIEEHYSDLINGNLGGARIVWE